MKTKFKTFESVSTPYKVGDYALINVLIKGVLNKDVLVKIVDISTNINRNNRANDILVNFLDDRHYNKKDKFIILPSYINCWSDSREELERIVTANKYNL